MKIKVALASLALVVATGCGTIAEQYVKADRDTYNALKPHLDGLGNDRVDRLVISWDERLDAAEAGNFGEEDE